MRRNRSISMFGLSPDPCSTAFVGAARPAFGPARAREGKRFAGCWPAAFVALASNVPSISRGAEAIEPLANFAHIGTFAASFLQTRANRVLRCRLARGQRSHPPRRSELRWVAPRAGYPAGLRAAMLLDPRAIPRRGLSGHNARLR